ncbi:MAG: hypothetical protein AAF602_28950, partial [Myxococcota bacterium]
MALWWWVGCGLVISEGEKGEHPDPEFLDTGSLVTPGSGDDTGLPIGGPRTDAFVVAVDSPIDVLFVIDDSANMLSYQQALAAELPRYFAFFEGAEVDHHLGVVTTDVDTVQTAGVLRDVDGLRYVDALTPDPADALASLVLGGTHGSENERGLAAAFLALGTAPPPENAGFRRPDAGLHVVVLSNDDDASRPEDLPTVGFGAWFDAIEGGFARSFSSLVPFTDAGFDTRGTAYLAVTAFAGGQTMDLNDPDWREVVTDLAVLHGGLTPTYFLRQVSTDVLR